MNVGMEVFMKILQLAVGAIGTNCYLLCDENTGKAAVVDPGADSSRILAELENLSDARALRPHRRGKSGQRSNRSRPFCPRAGKNRFKKPASLPSEHV